MEIAKADKAYNVFKVSVPSRGILFPNVYACELCNNNCMGVSVPSRGILFPNGAMPMLLLAIIVIMFPSPLGVSYFQMLQ